MYNNEYIGMAGAILDNYLWAEDSLERNTWLNVMIDISREQRPKFKAVCFEDGKTHEGFMINEVGQFVYIQEAVDGRLWVCDKNTLEEVK